MDGLCFPEAPRWHDGHIYCSDVFGRKVYGCDLSGRVFLDMEIPGFPSGLGWSRDGELLIVNMDDRREILRFDGKALSVFADLSVATAGWLNDMIVDRNGRAYVSGIGTNLESVGPTLQPLPASVLMVDTDGSVAKVADDIIFGNGMAITDGERTLVVAESSGRRLTAFDRDARGLLSNRRVFAELNVAPDGICADAEGAIWTALPQEKRFSRVLPDGTIAESISVAGRHALACALGGADGRTLLMTTRVGHIDDAKRLRSGRVETVQVDVPAAAM